MTFLSSFPPSLINSAGIWLCPVSSHFSIYLLLSLWCNHLAVQHVVLQFVRTLSTLLHSHCLFHLVVESAVHNIQTTFAGLSLCCLLCYLPYLWSVIFMVWILFLCCLLLVKISLPHCYYKQFPFPPALI